MTKMIAQFIEQKMRSIRQNEQTSAATLAKLRRGIGRTPGDDPMLWSILFEGMPEEMLSTNGAPTRAEWAVHTALTLFALHQQGKDLKGSSMHLEGRHLGQALSMLAAGDEEAMKRIKRRFDAMATADHMPETVYHLRGLVQLLRANDIALDYAALGKELFLLQIPAHASGVRLRWGQDFYRKYKEERDITQEEQGGNE